jgi:hypothetical protein
VLGNGQKAIEMLDTDASVTTINLIDICEWLRALSTSFQAQPFAIAEDGADLMVRRKRLN